MMKRLFPFVDILSNYLNVDKIFYFCELFQLLSLLNFRESLIWIIFFFFTKGLIILKRYLIDKS